MNKTIYIEKPDSQLQAIYDKAFPGYTGRKFKISVLTGNEMNLTGGYWDGGSKSTYVAVNLSTLQTFQPKGITAPPEFGGVSDIRTVVPTGTVVVEHDIFCGKQMGLTIWVPADTTAPLLPETTDEYTRDEKIVLNYTSRLKNSYGGETNIRFKEASIQYKDLTAEAWEIAKASLIGKKLLRKNGSITPDGRNVDTTDIRGY